MLAILDIGQYFTKCQEIISSYIVPERKVRSGMILDFGFKKESNFSPLEIFEQNREIIFRGFRSATN